MVVSAALLFGFLYFYEASFEVPVLMYHHVGSLEEKSSLNVSTEAFQNQMEFLKVHRYNVMSLSYLVNLIKSGKKIPPKTVVITFDDGNVDNFKNAFPILKKMNFPATIFMITANIGKPGWLSEEDLKILHESNISIGSHTVNHAFLPEVKTKEEIVFELGESRKRLEKILFYPVTLFSYPAGGFTLESKSLVEKQGYQGAVTTNHGKGKHDPYALHRIKITESKAGLFGFWIKTSGLYHLGKKRIPVR